MSIRTHKLSKRHQSLLLPFLRKTHSPATDEEMLQIILHELNTSREVRGVFLEQELHGVVSWEERGAPRHGVAEILRFTIPEETFSEAIAEILLDTTLASIDYFFTNKESDFRKLFMVIAMTRIHARDFLESRGFVREGELAHHYHQNRKEVLYSLFR